jgi:hypothetical protein
VDYEGDGLNSPATNFRANTGSETVGGSVTRVKAPDLDQLSNFLQSKFNYAAGPYQGYQSEVPSTRLLGKLDYNLNEHNKVSLRYNRLDSKSDALLSNSNSLGFGSRRSSTTALNFGNSNYQILENIRSIVGELNSAIGVSTSNALIAGYTHQDESRASRGGSITGPWFPFVDILDGGSVYTSFGMEPFTPNNELRYDTWQAQDNLTIVGNNHSFTFGASAEKYHSENVFFPGRARRGVHADGLALRLQLLAGAVARHRRARERSRDAHRHSQRRQPAQPPLGHRPVVRDDVAVDHLRQSGGCRR